MLGAAALGATAVALGVSAGAAVAHVSVDVDDAVAGQSALLEFSFHHGCDGEPTTALRIQVPESVSSVYPTIHPGWTIEMVTEAAEPGATNAHGEAVTERLTEVVFTAKEPIADGLRDVVVLQATLPDTPGETVYFPTIQVCGASETAWIEVPGEGQSADELAAPAPSFELVAADAAGEGLG